MADILKTRAELRRQKLLQNSERRMKLLLENKSANQADSDSREQFSKCSKACVDKNDVIQSEPVAAPKKLQNEDFINSPIAWFEREQKKDEKLLTDIFVKSKTEKKTKKGDKLVFWLGLCIIFAVSVSYNSVKRPNDNMPFIGGFIVYITLILIYVFLGDRRLTFVEPIFNLALNLVMKAVDFSENTKDFFLTFLNLLLLSANLFCVYCFFFFTSYKLFYEYSKAN